MTVTTKLSVLAGVAGVMFASSVHAQSAEWEFVTSTGTKLILSPIDGMQCAEMDKMLARIDSTRYRENAPTPHDEADAPLFEYELTLAEENYNRCVIVRKEVTRGIVLMGPLRKQ